MNTSEDDYIAHLIAKSYTGHSSSSSIKRKATEVNKQFLLNTLIGTKSHNRREEIADCWRERDLQSRLCKPTTVKESRLDFTNEIGGDVSATSLDREYWANMKAKKFSVENSIDASAVKREVSVELNISTRSSSPASVDSKKKKKDKSKKKKDDKDKKKKKKMKDKEKKSKK